MIALKKVNIHYPEEAFDYAANNELRVIFTHAIERLPQKQALVIDGRFLRSSPWELRSYRDIAKDINCSHEHVRKLETEGLNNLKETLGFLGGIFDSTDIPNVSKRIRPATCAAARKQTNRPGREPRACMTPLQIKEKARQDKHLWYLKNKDRKLLDNKRRYREDKAYHLWLCKRWQQDNPEAWKAYQRRYQKRRAENLGNAYVAERLTKGTNLTKQDIPHKLIELKRKQLILKRSIERT